MENLIEINHLTFSYPNSNNNAISDISLAIKPGEFVILCGNSGCGKTTLLKHMKSVLSPNGDMSGEILFNGSDLHAVDFRTQSSEIGFVMQNADNQIVTDKVWHEIAFGLESLGYDNQTIRRKTAEMSSFFGIQSWFYKDTSKLSGGQKQILNLASIMVMQPKLIILDEPTSQLDPIASEDFISILKKINRELGTAVIITEHRLDSFFCDADKIIVMKDGKIIFNDTPQNAGNKLNQGDILHILPVPVRIHSALSSSLPCPLTVKDGRDWLCEYAKTHQINAVPRLDDYSTKKECAIQIKNIWFKYEKNSPDIIKGLSLEIYYGEIFSVLGGNGSGKTTALSLISGINKPYRGKINIKSEKSKIAMLPQNPQTLFVKDTVAKDLHSICSDNEKIKYVAGLCGITHLIDRHPFDLSGGEQQKTALAKLLLLEPDILILDEPTKGLDPQFKNELGLILKNLAEAGTAIVMVSHDMEFCAEYSQRCALFFDGSIIAADHPRDFFSGNNFYTTSANRMSRHILKSAVTANDVIYACGGTINPNINSDTKQINTDKNENITPTKNTPSKGSPRCASYSKNSLIMSIISVLCVPPTIIAGIYLFEDRKYLFISMLMLIEMMLPFFMSFENRKPNSKELAILSAICAIGVAGRTAFFMLPQFKPLAAIVIISGIALGWERGFLVGAVTAFVSNFFFGQGPWTPWQMFCFGMIGCLAGLCFYNKEFKHKKIYISLFGFFSVLIVYGGIMNPASILMFQPNISFSMLAASYIAGIPFDLIHAAGTFIFLWIISIPMLNKLSRIKTKHGL